MWLCLQISLKFLISVPKKKQLFVFILWPSLMCDVGYMGLSVDSGFMKDEAMYNKLLSSIFAIDRSRLQKGIDRCKTSPDSLHTLLIICWKKILDKSIYKFLIGKWQVFCTVHDKILDLYNWLVESWENNTDTSKVFSSFKACLVWKSILF